jgi:DNA invertase Pin-like site-specific DNA recombinase
VFREKISGAAERPRRKKLMAAVGGGDVVIIPAVDRLSRGTTDLLVIARDLRKEGVGLRSIAERVVNTTSDFAELVLAMLGVAAKLERRASHSRRCPQHASVLSPRRAAGLACRLDRGTRLIKSCAAAVEPI